jgi:hypothetical protein
MAKSDRHDSFYVVPLAVPNSWIASDVDVVRLTMAPIGSFVWSKVGRRGGSSYGGMVNNNNNNRERVSEGRSCCFSRVLSRYGDDDRLVSGISIESLYVEQYHAPVPVNLSDT